MDEYEVRNLSKNINENKPPTAERVETVSNEEMTESTKIVIKKVEPLLKKLKKVPGVENAVLSQRDGGPIQWVGVWLNNREVFGVCSSTSAIFSVAEELHNGSLENILIDGERAKILVAPFHNSRQTFEKFDVIVNPPSFPRLIFLSRLPPALKRSLAAFTMS